MANPIDLQQVTPATYDSLLPQVNNLPALNGAGQYMQYTGNPIADAIIAQSNAGLANSAGVGAHPYVSYDPGAAMNGNGTFDTMVRQPNHVALGQGFSNVNANIGPYQNTYDLSKVSLDQLASILNNYGQMQSSIQSNQPATQTMSPGLATQWMGNIYKGLENNFGQNMGVYAPKAASPTNGQVIQPVQPGALSSLHPLVV